MWVLGFVIGVWAFVILYILPNSGPHLYYTWPGRNGLPPCQNGPAGRDDDEPGVPGDPGVRGQADDPGVRGEDGVPGFPPP